MNWNFISSNRRLDTHCRHQASLADCHFPPIPFGIRGQRCGSTQIPVISYNTSLITMFPKEVIHAYPLAICEQYTLGNFVFGTQYTFALMGCTLASGTDYSSGKVCEYAKISAIVSTGNVIKEIIGMPGCPKRDLCINSHGFSLAIVPINSGLSSS